MTSNRPLNIAFLGTGKVALDHAAALRALGHEIVVGCATSPFSPSWKNFLKIAPSARFEPDAERLLEDPSIDAALVCLPWDLTHKRLAYLLRTPKPLLIEKPLALGAKILEEILSRPETRPRNKIVGYNRRFYKPVIKLKERLKEGGLKLVVVTFSEPVNYLVKCFGASVIEYTFAHSSGHILDTLLYLLGSLRILRLRGHREQGYTPTFYSINGLLETEKGVPVYFFMNADTPVTLAIDFYFNDHTRWSLSPLERLVAFNDYEVIEPTTSLSIRRYVPKPFLEVVVDTSLKPGFLEQMEAFTLGDNKEIAATPEDSLALLKLVEAMKSAVLNTE